MFWRWFILAFCPCYLFKTQTHSTSRLGHWNRRWGTVTSMAEMKIKRHRDPPFDYHTAETMSPQEIGIPQRISCFGKRKPKACVSQRGNFSTRKRVTICQNVLQEREWWVNDSWDHTLTGKGLFRYGSPLLIFLISGSIRWTWGGHWISVPFLMW